MDGSCDKLGWLGGWVNNGPELGKSSRSSSFDSWSSELKSHPILARAPHVFLPNFFCFTSASPHHLDLFLASTSTSTVSAEAAESPELLRFAQGTAVDLSEGAEGIAAGRPAEGPVTGAAEGVQRRGVLRAGHAGGCFG